MDNTNEIVRRFVAVWNETDPAARRSQIQSLWTPDGVHYVKAREARGYDALDVRVTGAHENNVERNGLKFVATGDAERLQDVIKFHWHMTPKDSSEIVAVGLEFLVMSEDGRIVRDYQFIVPS
jgi:hypothetical protein